jgi:peptidoglycan/LPS O-acetylase OafA/YrhL
MSTKTIYLPGLNGLRAIAALAVVFSHTTLALPDFGSDFNLFGFTAVGKPKGYLLASYGVTIFFTLSGFLITYLLLLEKQKQPIDIKKFYIRRILRIWPLYYTYFAICLITIFIFHKEFNTISAICITFFTSNNPYIYIIGLPFLAHYWSLAVEEQFYLFWPWIVKKVEKNLIPIIFALIVIQNVFRVIVWYLYPSSDIANFSIINRFDTMMIGALGAILYVQNHKLFLKFIDNKITQFIGLTIIGLLIINKFHTNAIVDTFIISIVTLILIIGQINIKNRLINLDIKIFDFFGKISFGIYIYHPLLLFFLSLIIKGLKIETCYKTAIAYLFTFIFTILIAYISYHCFEIKFIKMKNKFTIIKSSGHKI